MTKKNKGKNNKKNQKPKQQHQPEPPQSSSGLPRGFVAAPKCSEDPENPNVSVNYPWNQDQFKKIFSDLQKLSHVPVDFPEPKDVSNEEVQAELKEIMELPKDFDLYSLEQDSKNAVKVDENDNRVYNNAEATTFLLALMDRFIRVDMDDGRSFTGVLKGIDNKCNICLSESYEYWRNAEGKLDAASFHSKRPTGMVMVPGRYTASVFLLNPTFDNDASENYYKKDKNYIELRKKAYFARKEQQDQADAERKSEYDRIVAEAESRPTSSTSKSEDNKSASEAKEDETEEIQLEKQFSSEEYLLDETPGAYKKDVEERNLRVISTEQIMTLSKFTSYLPAEASSWNRNREVLATEENVLLAKMVNKRINACGGYKPVQRGGIMSGRPVQLNRPPPEGKEDTEESEAESPKVEDDKEVKGREQSEVQQEQTKVEEDKRGDAQSSEKNEPADESEVDSLKSPEKQSEELETRKEVVLTEGESGEEARKEEVKEESQSSVSEPSKEQEKHEF